MTNSLRDTLNDMSIFIKLEVGEEFTGVYKSFRRVPNTFDMDKEAIELTFEVNGNEKSMTSMSLASALAENNIQEGDVVRIKKVSKKGNTITWLVEKQDITAESKVTAEEAEKALG